MLALLTLLENRPFIPGENSHLYRLSIRYKPSNTNVGSHLYRVVLSPGKNVSRPPPPTIGAPPFPPLFPFLFSVFFFLSTSQSHMKHNFHLHSHTSTIIHSLTIIHPNQDLHERKKITHQERQ
jgi:hypothetical protein